jgi:hypothetical protein
MKLVIEEVALIPMPVSEFVPARIVSRVPVRFATTAFFRPLAATGGAALCGGVAFLRDVVPVLAAFPLRVKALFLAAVFSLAPAVWASCTSHSTSTYTYTSCSDGTSSMSQTIGNNTYTTSSDGSSGTSFQSGNTTYHTNRHGSGTTYRTGHFAQHHWSDGSNGSSRREGLSTRHDWRHSAVGGEQKLGERQESGLDRARELQSLAERRAMYGHISGQSSVRGSSSVTPAGTP